LSSEYIEVTNGDANKIATFLQFIPDKVPEVVDRYKNGIPRLRVVRVYVIIDWSLCREGSL